MLRAILGTVVIMAVFSAGGVSVGSKHTPSVNYGQNSTLGSRYPLFKDSRADLALALAGGKDKVSVLLATTQGRNQSVALRMQALGASVVYRDDAVGYLRALVPLNEVEEVVDGPDIESAAVDKDMAVTRSSFGTRHFDGSSPSTQTTSGVFSRRTGDWPPRLSDRPIHNPYSPLKDMDASEFLKQHPTFDGRGVTIAIIDGFTDLLSPELQTATTIDGKPTKKVIDYINPSDPDVDRGPEWVDMRNQVTASGKHISYKGVDFIAPRDGTYRIGFLDERRFVPPYTYWLGGDLNRDGNPEGSSGLFGVLWDENSNEVWVDTNQNRDFTDDKSMKDYHIRHDVGIFGTDDGSVPIRKSLSFTIQTDLKRKLVSINVGDGVHATVVAGAAAGNMSNGGRYNGVAPGAQVIAINTGAHATKFSAYIEAMILAFQDPRVDLIVYEWNSGMAGPYLLKDGAFVASVVCNRLIEKYKKPFLVPANNTAGLNRVLEDGMAALAISVGAYQSKENYLVNSGLVVTNEDNLHFSSSYGPGGNGTLNPLVLSPSNVLSSFPAFVPTLRVKGLYRLPPGYIVASGTSTAAAVAGGAVALLISGAKQRGLSYDAESLRYAIASSARYIPHIDAHKQGNGLIQVEAAWDDVLNTLQRGNRPVSITSRAPVRTAVSDWLRTPNEGIGIYEREGWKVGDQGTRDIIFTRTSGGAGPMQFGITWLGNDGTFCSGSDITLPLNEPARIAVKIWPKSAGVHSAILNLDNPQVPGHAYRMMTTVVAAEQYSNDGQYSIKKKAEVERPGTGCFYFNVPSGVSAFKVNMIASDARMECRGLPPNSDEWPVGQWRMDDVATTVFGNPDPGVWEVTVRNTKDGFEYNEEDPAPVTPTPISLAASVLGVEVTPSSSLMGPARVGGTYNLNFRFRNRFGMFSGGVKSCPLGSAHKARATIAHHEQQLYEINVLPGSQLLMVQIGHPSDEGADLDLYLFNCTGDTPILVKKRIGSSADEVVFVEHPPAGLWKVVVDAFKVPSVNTTYEYLDIFTNPQFGYISVSDVDRDHASGEEWTAKASVWVANVPRQDRAPGGLLVVSSDNVKSALHWPPEYWRELIIETVPVGWGVIMFEPDSNESAR